MSCQARGQGQGQGWARGCGSPGGWLVAAGPGPALTEAGGRGRLYLGDRLLTQGPSWLEGAIVEQIGLCFPSRFPQEMLSNLAQSEELQRQFCLFQLQEQDRRLLELGSGPAEVRGVGARGGRSRRFPHGIPEPDWGCPVSPCPGGAGSSPRRGRGEGAGPVSALLARVPALLHG